MRSKSVRFWFVFVTIAGLAGCGDSTGTQSAALIHLSQTSITFDAVAAGADPPPQSVPISNGGGSALTGLAASISYGSGQPTGWLTATLGGTSAPAALQLQADVGSIGAGSYTAQVAVQSPGASNTPQTINVTFNVAAQPAIALAQTSIVFSANAGGANPTGQSIAITNSGGGTLIGLTLGAITYGTGQQTGWLSAQLSQQTAPATLALQATTGSVAPGTYVATLSISSLAASNSPATLTVTLSVADATAPTVTAVAPVNAAAGVPRHNTAFTATFSEPVDAATVTTATFVVTIQGSPISGTVTLSADGLTAMFVPSASLPANADVLATVKGGATGVVDLAGNRMAADHSWTFRTNNPPTITAAPDLDVTSGTSDVTLIATATDADGQLLRFLWQQIGPPVVGIDPATGTFDAPNDVVTLHFDVQAYDGQDVSEFERVVVRVFEDVARTIWVSTTGNDANSGTQTSPKLTIQNAIDASTDGADVYVMAGTYTIATPLMMRSGVSVYGGYNPTTFIRDLNANETVIDAASTRAIIVNGQNALRIDGLTLHTVMSTLAGGSSTGIAVAGSDDIVIKRNTIVAAPGTDGATGATGGVGSAAVAGSNGQNATETRVCPRAGGAGGVGPFDSSGGAGGGSTVDGGEDGTAAAPPRGGAGGPASTGAAAASPGVDGGPGPNGAPGAHSTTFGALGLAGPASPNGSTGGTGEFGGGGGGGGSGFSDSGCGGAGGGGGSGGGGGQGGHGGQNGGGSFGIIVILGSERAHIEQNVIFARDGGNGGGGGLGGSGAPGGDPGLGGSGTLLASAGGDGGRGGVGGTGGRGGGGRGGSSVGVAVDVTSSTNLAPDAFAGNQLVFGAAGAGGVGSAGSTAPQGIAAAFARWNP
jgi:hypothetical protein